MRSARYNPPQRMIFCFRLLVAAALVAFALPAALAATWEQPAAALARQIAALSGPGPVQLFVSNRSGLSPDQIPLIHRLLKQDLRRLRVLPGGGGTATVVRVTLSQNLQGGLWVAEVQQGTQTQVTMLPVYLGTTSSTSGGPPLTLRRSILITEPDPVLDAQIFTAGSEQRLVVLEPAQILVYARNADSLAAGAMQPAWALAQTLAIPPIRPAPRDLRGRIVAGLDHLFDAWLPGMLCRGANDGPKVSLSCSPSDDPWPVTASQKAFYDSARDYFTGVLVPGLGVELNPFYEAAEIPHPGGAAALLNNVDGTAVLIENHRLEPLSGTEDWGSDLAALHSPCGTGTAVVVSGSGAASAGDSLRAYAIPGNNVIPASAPLPVPGTVMAIWPAAGGNRVIAIVREQGSAGYEVWSIAASCD